MQGSLQHSLVILTLKLHKNEENENIGLLANSRKIGYRLSLNKKTEKQW